MYDRAAWILSRQGTFEEVVRPDVVSSGFFGPIGKGMLKERGRPTGVERPQKCPLLESCDELLL